MTSTKVRSRSMVENLRSFSKEIAHAVKALVSVDDVVDSKAAAEFYGTRDKIEEAESRRERSRRQSSSSGRSTLTRIQPESPFHDMGHEDR